MSCSRTRAAVVGVVAVVVLRGTRTAHEPEPMRRWLLLSSVLVQLACPEVAPPPAASGAAAPCATFGAKCKTPTGPLGVCDSIPCPAGAPGPCFKCMPQH